MLQKITVSDYSYDWAMKERNLDRRTKPGYMSREEVVAYCGTLDVQGIELNHLYWEDYSSARLKQLATDAGLPIVSYVGFTDLAVPPSGRPKALDQVFAFLDRTAELGSSRTSLLIIATYKQEFTMEQQRAWLIENARMACERASSMGITMLCENIDYPPARPLLGRGADCHDTCEQVGHPAFRLIYDVGAPLFVQEDSLETLRQMRPYVAHVHLKNFRALAHGEHTDRFIKANDGTRYTGTTLEAGTVKIEPVVAELVRNGYEGIIQVEYQGEDDPRIALKQNVEYIRGMLAKLV